MATNLAGGVNIAELQACVVRIALLDSDCTATGGTNGGIVTAGLVTLTAEPDIEEGTVYEQKNGCGTILFTYEKQDAIKRYNLSGEFAFADFEMLQALFGGTLVLGKGGGSYAGKVIGHADRLYNAAQTNGVYLEVITTAITEGAGSCTVAGAAAPVAIGHIFGKARFTPGAQNFADDIKRIAFTGKSTNNPNLYDGPWDDFPGAGYIPNSAHVAVGYSQAEYDAIVATIAPGFQNLPTGS
jgi:hypothetical protein